MIRKNIGNEQQNGAQDPSSVVRRLATEAIKSSGKTRLTIAEEMSSRLGTQTVTIHMLNDYTAKSKDAARFPAAFVQAFCETTGNDDLQRYLMGATLRRLVELAEHELVSASEQREKQILLDELAAEQRNSKGENR